MAKRSPKSQRRAAARSPSLRAKVVTGSQVTCPVCDSVVARDGELTECEHFIFFHDWARDRLKTRHPAMRAWWASEVETLKGSGELPSEDTMKRCPHIQYLVFHRGRGMACGPVGVSTAFGFARR